MSEAKSLILSRLQKEILHLQGFKSVSGVLPVDPGLGPITHAFPQNKFPEGAIHEFIAYGHENSAATSGFISALLAAFMQHDGVVLWIGAQRKIFPPALQAFGLHPHKIIFIDLRNEREVLWTVEEALKCTGITAVAGELKELGFTASRRLQLAVENSHVTGFILRNNPRTIHTTACVTRWQISSLPSVIIDDLPGVGVPRWKVNLLKVRNGKPGTWEVAWRNGQFYFEEDRHMPAQQPQKQTG
jgi:Uncharacterized conserved protein